MNFRAIKAIYLHEMLRFWQTFFQSIASPILATALYLVVFGAAIGSRIDNLDNVSFELFIIPGLIMLQVLIHSFGNASFGIFFPKFVGGIYEILSAPVSFYIVLIGFVGAAASKSMILATIILITVSFFVDLSIAHPFWMMTYLILTCVSFSLFGFIVGLWADNFEKLQIVPSLLITPLVFLGGTFYHITMLPPFWQKVTLLNPVFYLVSGFRWSFYEGSHLSKWVSLLMIIIFLSLCIAVVSWMFKSGYKLKQ
jgi:ABC-2 type transport system permease protein